MVIQSYSVSASSQRTFLSANSSGFLAANNSNTAQFAGTTGQGGNTTQVPDQGTGNQNGQGQNTGNNANTGVGQSNNPGNNGQTGNGNTNGTGNNANTGVGQTKNSGNNGQVAAGQGENVNNQGQSNGDIFKDALQKAQDERDNTIQQMVRTSSTSRVHMGNLQRTPTTPQELRARLSQIIYHLLHGKYQKPQHHPPQIENFDDWRGLNMFPFFGGGFGTGTVQQPQDVAGINMASFQYESETVSYQATGVVHTADGKTINIDINMHMSREFVSFMNISGDGSALVDPLVINYGGTAASLMGEKFLFDLTMDGNTDNNIAILGEGSGFLAIDWNGDGKINDGSQLFGPSTGCGFNELRKYDKDGNGWIDSGDEIFDKLVVWRRNADGSDTVYTLKELGIGAIFLGDISTEFSFKGDGNETLGVMRSTSFFIKGCGGTGTLSHIDLAL